MENCFEFRSRKFNRSEERDYFINPNCFGDDLAEWLIKEMGAKGVETSERPGQEDFGWYFSFVVDSVGYRVVLGFQPNDVELGDCWLGWVERDNGILGSILGRRDRKISTEAIQLVDSIFRASAEIRDLKWSSPQDK